MKPPEILGMIEEAAGTRMFENKKQVGLFPLTCDQEGETVERQRFIALFCIACSAGRAQDDREEGGQGEVYKAITCGQRGMAERERRSMRGITWT